ncbi:MAG: hypothetical protein CL865_01695 [Cycloclasticus sp.]|nr:hypothetical protein [Cycloclasticus sp.]
MQINSNRRLLAAAVAMLVGGGEAVAQSSQLEEVVVTARKKEESIMDVPISVAAMSGEKLSAYNITDFDAMAAMMPGVNISDGILEGAVLNIRGVQTEGGNAGFEQSVGLFIDGMYIGRSSFSRQGQLDVAQVEVLKGPQSLYFGKNTIAGALNIRTNNPGDEFEAYLQAGYEFESADQLSVEGVVSGPIAEGIKGRLATRFTESDGWLENPYASGDAGMAQEDLFLRGTLVFDGADNFSDTLKINYMDSEAHEDLINCVGGPGLLAFQVQGSQEDCVRDDTVTHVLTSQAMLDYLDDTGKHGGQRVKPGETSYNVFKGITIVNRADWDISDQLSLTNVTAYLDTDWDRSGNVNQYDSAGPFFQREELTDFWSTEFKLSGEFSDRITWAAGFYYQEEDIEYEEFTRLILTDDDNRNGVPLEPGDVLGQSWAGPKRQEQSEYSIFAEVSIDMTDTLNLNIGGRYTDTEKDIDHTTCASGIGNFGPAGIFTSSEAICDDGATDFLPIANDQIFSTSLSEDEFSPSVQLTWRPGNESMYYVSYVEGFKAGGFNFDQRAPVPPLDSNGDGVPDVGYQFDKENAEAVELGTKLTLAEGRVQLTAAYFYTEYTDLQVSAYDDDLISFFTVNAGESEVQGLEADVTWYASDVLMLGASVLFLDAEFTEFSGARCTNDATPDDPVSGTCDFSGNSLPNAADFQSNLFATLRTDLGENLVLDLRADAAYTGEVDDWEGHIYGDNDAWWNLNASISLGSADEKWRISLVGINLLDEDDYLGWDDHRWNAALSGIGAAVGQPGNYYTSDARQGRQVSLVARYNF